MIQVTEKILYEQDFALWLQTTIARLRVGDLHNLDTKHLILVMPCRKFAEITQKFSFPIAGHLAPISI